MKPKHDAPMLSRSASCEASGTISGATGAQSGQTPDVSAGRALDCTWRSVRSNLGQQESGNSEAHSYTLDAGVYVQEVS